MSPDGEHIDSSPRFSVLRAVLVLVVFAVGVAALVAVGTRPSVSTPSPTTFPPTGSNAAATTTTTTTASSATTAPSTTTTTRRGSHHGTPASGPTPTVAHGTVSVVVANGTNTTGLAAHFSSVLGGSGWQMKTPANTSAPQTSSAVYYASGEQAAASEIATALGVKKSQVLPISSSVPVSAVTGTDVVVVIGQDLAGAGTGTSTSTSTGTGTGAGA